MNKLLCITLLATGCVDEQSVGSSKPAAEVIGAARWAITLGDVGDDDARSVAIASNGDVFVVGAFTGTVDFGGSVFSSPPDNCNGDGLPCYDSFLTRRAAADGHELWTHAWSSGAPAPDQIAIAAGDGLVGLGWHVVGGTAVQALMRYDSVGTLVWTYDFPQPLRTADLAVDYASGRIAVVGWYKGPVDLPSGHSDSPSGDGFVELLDASGAPQWSISTTGFDNHTSSAIGHVAFTPGGDILVSGTTGTLLSFAGASLQNTAYESSFLARLTTAGSLEWATVNSDAGYTQYGGLVASDTAGNAVVSTGRRADSDGGDDIGRAIFQTVDPAGAMITQHVGEDGTGGAQAFAVVGDTRIAVESNTQRVATELTLRARDASGQILADQPFGPAPSNRAGSLFRSLVHRDRALAMVGFVDGSADLGTGPLRWAGGDDIAIAVYDLPEAP